MIIYLLASSPIEARQNPRIYLSILVGIGIILLLFLINILIRNIQKNIIKKSIGPDSPTTNSIIQKVAQILSLTKEEKTFLKQICNIYKVANFEYKLRDTSFIDSFFKMIYQKLDENTQNKAEIESKKAILFSIRQKIENLQNSSLQISSTKNIKVGQLMYYIANNKDQYPVTLIESTPDELIVSSPNNVLNNNVKIQPLTKISVFFETKESVAYTFHTRVIRYQTRKTSELVLSHSNNIQILHRRSQKRISYNPECVFSAVQVVSEGKGKQSKINFKPLEKKHMGKLSDLSSDGCCIITNLNIQENQYIYLTIKFDEKHEDSIVGIILKNVKNQNNSTFDLHIRFVRLNKKTRNKIFSIIFDYHK